MMRAVVLAVRPEVDGGRYPAKCVVGEPVAIEADIVSDGHDTLRAVVRDLAPGATAWRETELVLGPDDTWRATVPIAALGVHRFTVEAWIDAFATWRRGLERKHAAGVDVDLDLRDGAVLVAAAAARVNDADLRTAVGTLTADSPIAARVAFATSAALAEAMARAPDRSAAARYVRELELVAEPPLAASAAWYELFPRSTGAAGKHGTLRDAEGRLDYVAALGFDIVYLPPIHPIGHAYRKGPDNAPTAGPDDPGSPWAIGAAEGGHTAVHPQLGTLADFDHFVAAARARKLEVALDIAFQASPDHPWVTEHPTWFKARADGSIQYAENPPKKYQDVYPFDFASADWRGLWDALRDVFLFWAARGVRVFRVDNPHTKPIPFWEWCLREVRAHYPDAMFLAEAFTRPKLMYALAKVGFSQSYTYFSWRTTAAEFTAYAAELARPEICAFYRPCFWPTTPDIFPDYLIDGGRPAFVMRAVLAATLAASWGIYGPSYELCEHEPRPGVEELAHNEKYQLRTWNLDDPNSIRHVIARLNKLRRAHSAFANPRSVTFHPTDNEAIMCFSKVSVDRRDCVIVIVNLDPHHTHRAYVTLDLAALGITSNDDSFQVHDLLGDARYSWRGARNFVELTPAQSPAHVFEVRRFVRSEHQFEYFL